MIPLELHIYMSFYVMHTWILTSQNDLWFFLWMYKLNYILWCMMLIIIYIFYIIHNIQLSYDYNYVNLITCLHRVAKLHMLNVKWWTLIFHIHYNNRGLFCDLNIIANNKERSFQKLAVANHNSLQTLKLLWYHNIRTRTIASPSQLQNLIQSQNFPIITASIHCLRLTLHQKLFATHPSLQRLSESTQKSIGFRYKI